MRIAIILFILSKGVLGDSLDISLTKEIYNNREVISESVNNTLTYTKTLNKNLDIYLEVDTDLNQRKLNSSITSGITINF